VYSLIYLHLGKSMHITNSSQVIPIPHVGDDAIFENPYYLTHPDQLPQIKGTISNVTHFYRKNGEIVVYATLNYLVQVQSLLE
jgi:hypothetical protein